MKEYIFMTGLQKDKSNPVFSCVRTDVKIWLQAFDKDIGNFQWN